MSLSITRRPRKQRLAPEDNLGPMLNPAAADENSQQEVIAKVGLLVVQKGAVGAAVVAASEGFWRLSA